MDIREKSVKERVERIYVLSVGKRGIRSKIVKIKNIAGYANKQIIEQEPLNVKTIKKN